MTEGSHFFIDSFIVLFTQTFHQISDLRLTKSFVSIIKFEAQKKIKKKIMFYSPLSDEFSTYSSWKANIRKYKIFESIGEQSAFDIHERVFR